MAANEGNASSDGKTIFVVCPNCGASTKTEYGRATAYCSSCGKQYDVAQALGGQASTSIPQPTTVSSIPVQTSGQGEWKTGTYSPSAKAGEAMNNAGPNDIADAANSVAQSAAAFASVAGKALGSKLSQAAETAKTKGGDALSQTADAVKSRSGAVMAQTAETAKGKSAGKKAPRSSAPTAALITKSANGGAGVPNRTVLLVAIAFVALLVFMLMGHGGSSDDGKINPPQSSSDFEGQNYEAVASALEDAGFTNVTTEKDEDLITGLLNSDGDVESVSIDGDTTFSTSSGYDPDDPVIVTYHTYPEGDEQDTTSQEGAGTEQDGSTEQSATPAETTTEESQPEVITVANNTDFAAIMQVRDQYDPSIAQFVQQHAGSVVEVDGHVSAFGSHDGNKTRYDLLVEQGNFEETTAVEIVPGGPVFKIEDVNYYELCPNDGAPEEVRLGTNARFQLRIDHYDSDQGLVFVQPVATYSR